MSDNLQVLSERTRAAAEFARLTNSIVANKHIIAACDGVEGIETYRASVEAENAELERQLRACGDRVLQLAAAVMPEATPTSESAENDLATARTLHFALGHGVLPRTRGVEREKSKRSC